MRGIERLLWVVVVLAVGFLALSYDGNRTAEIPATPTYVPYSANPEALRRDPDMIYLASGLSWMYISPVRQVVVNNNLGHTYQFWSYDFSEGTDCPTSTVVYVDRVQVPMSYTRSDGTVEIRAQYWKDVNDIWQRLCGEAS